MISWVKKTLYIAMNLFEIPCGTRWPICTGTINDRREISIAGASRPRSCISRRGCQAGKEGGGGQRPEEDVLIGFNHKPEVRKQASKQTDRHKDAHKRR